jgi:exodeoxyribonuclease VIII
MHVMVDLETMGNRPSAPIIAIGAVAFDKKAVHDEFYVVVDLADSVAEGAVMDPSTVLWWMKQSDEARAEFQREGQPLGLALGMFREWVAKFAGDIDGVWGNGASFDNVILSESYRRMGNEAPWPFWADRCYRTVKSVTKMPMGRTGTHHNALDDARDQAMHLMTINDEWGIFL